MVKEIDVGASQMGIEVLTNDGSKDNPTKSVELQKAPDKPYTIEDHSKMFEAMGNPEKAAELTIFLLSDDSNGISGKFLSAPWDPWQDKTFQEKLREDNDLATLRRIDEKYFFKKIG